MLRRGLSSRPTRRRPWPAHGALARMDGLVARPGPHGLMARPKHTGGSAVTASASPPPCPPTTATSHQLSRQREESMRSITGLLSAMRPTPTVCAPHPQPPSDRPGRDWAVTGQELLAHIMRNISLVLCTTPSRLLRGGWGGTPPPATDTRPPAAPPAPTATRAPPPAPPLLPPPARWAPVGRPAGASVLRIIIPCAAERKAAQPCRAWHAAGRDESSQKYFLVVRCRQSAASATRRPQRRHRHPGRRVASQILMRPGLRPGLGQAGPRSGVRCKTPFLKSKVR